MFDTNHISSILLPLTAAIVCIGCAALFIGIMGIRKAPSTGGKISVLLSILVFAVFCSVVIIFLFRSRQTELYEVLQQAATAGNTAKAKALVAQGANIDKKDLDGFTLLRHAIERRDFQKFRTLVEAGANVNDRWPSRHKNGYQTPLQLVLERSYYSEREEFDYPAVKLLLEHGAKFDFKANDGRGTCLQRTIEKRQIEILKLMLDNGADIHIKDDFHQGGVLHWAVGNMQIIKLLLPHHPDVNAKNRNGDTPLHLAAMGNHLDVVAILLENGADVNAKNRNENTPLHLAAMRKQMDIAVLLLDNGADVNAENSNHRTPFQYVLQNSYSLAGDEIDQDVKRLLDFGAKFNSDVIDNRGKTCIQNAIENNKIALLKVMIENGADIDVRPGQGSVLHWAVGKNASIPMLKFLLSLHPDVNARDGYGNTPLHWAVLSGRTDLESILIQNGIDAEARNNLHMTAYEWAESRQNPKPKPLRKPFDPNDKTRGSGIMMLRGQKNESKQNVFSR